MAAALPLWSLYFSSAKKTFLLLFFALTIAKTSQAYFGISSKEPISDFLSNEITDTKRLPNLSNRELCTSFNLHHQQRRSCRKQPGIATTLLEAIRLSAIECQRVFEYDRWNCSLDSTRISLLKKGFKETALLYAISSAGLVNAFARACSSGVLNQCTCDESLNDKGNQRTWLWGSCGDNIKFGQKLARSYLHHKQHENRDLRALVDRHNSEVGISVVRQLVSKKCKCHGVSGTCTTKICWKQLADFHKTGEQLKKKYDSAIEGSTDTFINKGHSGLTTDFPPQHKHSNARQKRRREKWKLNTGTSQIKTTDFGLRNRDLVYLETSPDFCTKNKYSPGTSGRICIKGNNCEMLCCGRGHNVQVKNFTNSCHCKVIWCCRVECQTCVEEKEVYTCK